jgi:sensor domain CHASE-containing protein
MKRIYLQEAVKSRPILIRLADNVAADVELVSSLIHTTEKDPNTTVKQFRQALGSLEEDLEKLQQRLAQAELSLQMNGE